MNKKEIKDNAHHKYENLEAALSNPTTSTQPKTLLEDTLKQANREVAIKDMLSLMLVNMWMVLAKVMAPIFLAHKRNHKN